MNFVFIFFEGIFKAVKIHFSQKVTTIFVMVFVYAINSEIKKKITRS